MYINIKYDIHARHVFIRSFFPSRLIYRVFMHSFRENFSSQSMCLNGFRWGPSIVGVHVAASWIGWRRLRPFTQFTQSHNAIRMQAHWIMANNGRVQHFSAKANDIYVNGNGRTFPTHLYNHELPKTLSTFGTCTAGGMPSNAKWDFVHFCFRIHFGRLWHDCIHSIIKYLLVDAGFLQTPALDFAGTTDWSAHILTEFPDC